MSLIDEIKAGITALETKAIATIEDPATLDLIETETAKIALGYLNTAPGLDQATITAKLTADARELIAKAPGDIEGNAYLAPIVNAYIAKIVSAGVADAYTEIAAKAVGSENPNV
jgi:hypothetical protein